jgi:hypothetical protein
VGSIIAEAMKKVGKDGVITVEESKTMETTLEVVEGMQFSRVFPVRFRAKPRWSRLARRNWLAKRSSHLRHCNKRQRKPQGLGMAR